MKSRGREVYRGEWIEVLYCRRGGLGMARAFFGKLIWESGEGWWFDDDGASEGFAVFRARAESRGFLR